METGMEWCLLGLQLPSWYPVEPDLAGVDRGLGFGKYLNAGGGGMAWEAP